ncbi:MAG: phosphoethanolamine transferase [Chromatiales bacterium]|nr:phosphoethanolamine transferase [Chromatiales bacterium]
MQHIQPVAGRRRPTLSVEALLLLASVAFAALYNGALWQRLFGSADFLEPRTAALFAGLFLAVTCIQFAGLALLLTRRTVRPVLAVLFLCTAIASYYMNRYTVFLNTEMLRNILRTDPAEAGELLTLHLVPHLLLYAAVPIALVFWTRVQVRPLRRAVLVRAGSVGAALVVAVLAVVVQYGDAASLIRSHRDARHLVTPTNYLASLFKISREAVAEPHGAPRRIALDAHRGIRATAGRKPALLVLAIGETVRSANFGLSGYARQTTPELSQLDLLVYPRVQACGTSTEVSLPCMFAPIGRRDYDEKRIANEESLLQVLKQVGVEVVWIDNQSGCKGVCDGLPEERIGGAADPALCDGERCLDGIMLPRLQAAVKAHAGDLVVVLHLLGNHGPAYSRRYPPEFREFVPTCESLELNDCSPEEIVNAYDNAILYTDHVLTSIVRYLQAESGRDTGLIYVSDHGESLGEAGFYLHGLPYTIAPAVQREVPMLVWLSKGLESAGGFSRDCLRQGTDRDVAHDHLFHSVLGLLNVETVVREPALDLFSACRNPVGTQMVSGDPPGLHIS